MAASTQTMFATNKCYFTGDDALQRVGDYIFDFEKNTLTSFVKVKATKKIESTGQFKNRFLLAYLMWRVIVGLNWEKVLKFQIAGYYTRCTDDAGFAHIKKLYRRFSVMPPRLLHFRKNSADEEQTTMLAVAEQHTNDCLLPEILRPVGLSWVQQEYFRAQKRPHVRQEFQNILCPPLDEE